MSRGGSPWVVEVADGCLVVAMAGTSQVWRVALPGTVKVTLHGRCEVYHGSGRELEKNTADGRVAARAHRETLPPLRTERFLSQISSRL